VWVRAVERLLAGVDSHVVEKLVLVAHSETALDSFLVVEALKYAVLLLHGLVLFEAVVLEGHALGSLLL